jgi:DNA sulfur modification protein DndB
MAISSSHTLNVPATRGRMGHTEYFTANFPMGMVVKLFTYNPDDMAELPIEERLQRALKKQRVPEIADYILNNDDYIFSSITVSVDAEDLDFQPSELDDNVGILKLPMEANWVVNDGQHRVAGIADAIKKRPELRNDNLSVVVLPDEGLERCQQIFSDLNRTVLKTSKSLDILFDHRSPINRITNAVVEATALFKDKTDKERVSLSLRSSSFATLSSVQTATAALLQHVKIAELDANYNTYEEIAIEFWNHVTTLVEPWAEVATGVRKPADARTIYLSSYAIMLAAVGSAGSSVLSNGADWKKQLNALKDVDFRKANPEWQGYCMTGGEVVTRVSTRKSMGDLLRWKLGYGTKPQQSLI